MRSIFYTAQNTAVAIKLGGRGDVTDTHVVWRERKYLPYVPSRLYSDGFLLTVKDGGIVVTRDARTGQTVKRGRVSHTSAYYSSPVVGGGRVILFSQLADWTVLATADRPAKCDSARRRGRKPAAGHRFGGAAHTAHPLGFGQRLPIRGRYRFGTRHIGQHAQVVQPRFTAGFRPAQLEMVQDLISVINVDPHHRVSTRAAYRLSFLSVRL